MSQTPEQAYELDDNIAEKCAAQYKEDAYFQSPPIIPEDIAKLLADAIISLKFVFWKI